MAAQDSEYKWSTGEVPEDWRRAVIIPVHKKGSRTECSNYRGISLQLFQPGWLAWVAETLC